MRQKFLGVIVGALGMLAYNQLILKRRQDITFMMIEALRECVDSTVEWIDIQEQLMVDDEFEEIVEQNFEEGL